MQHRVRLRRAGRRARVRRRQASLQAQAALGRCGGRLLGEASVLGERFLAGFPSTEHPHLAEHIRYHIDTRTFDEGDFEFGLDLILDSLAAER